MDYGIPTQSALVSPKRNNSTALSSHPCLIAKAGIHSPWQHGWTNTLFAQPAHERQPLDPRASPRSPFGHVDHHHEVPEFCVKLWGCNATDGNRHPDQHQGVDHRQCIVCTVPIESRERRGGGEGKGEKTRSAKIGARITRIRPPTRQPQADWSSCSLLVEKISPASPWVGALQS